MLFIIIYNGLAMNSTGANWRLLSDTRIAKSYCFDLFFLSRAKSIRFCGLHKYTQTFRLCPKPVLFIGFVMHRHFLNLWLFSPSSIQVLCPIYAYRQLCPYTVLVFEHFCISNHPKVEFYPLRFLKS